MKNRYKKSHDYKSGWTEAGWYLILFPTLIVGLIVCLAFGVRAEEQKEVQYKVVIEVTYEEQIPWITDDSTLLTN